MMLNYYACIFLEDNWDLQYITHSSVILYYMYGRSNGKVAFKVSELSQFYDKRDDFNFHITNFPFLSSNIPSSPAYGVFISQLIRYARACSSYECFILRAMRLSNKLLGQGYVKERLESSLRKFYGRYGDLTKQYEVLLSRMLHDILDDDHIQWHPPLIGNYTNFLPLLVWTLLPNLTFYLIVQGFHRTFATGAACQQRTLTPSGHLVLSHLGFAFVHQTETTLPTCDAYRIRHIYQNLHYRIREVSTEYMQRVWHTTGDADSSGHLVLSHFGTCMCSNVETNLSWTCLVSGLLNFEHPSVLLFCSSIYEWLRKLPIRYLRFSDLFSYF